MVSCRKSQAQAHASTQLTSTSFPTVHTYNSVRKNCGQFFSGLISGILESKLMPQYLFSHFRASEFDSLHRELSKVLAVDQARLRSLYEVMRSEFDADASPTEHTLP